MSSVNPKRPAPPPVEASETACDLRKWFAAVPIDHPFISAIFECCAARQRDAEVTEKKP